MLADPLHLCGQSQHSSERKGVKHDWRAWHSKHSPTVHRGSFWHSENQWEGQIWALFSHSLSLCFTLVHTHTHTHTHSLSLNFMSFVPLGLRMINCWNGSCRSKLTHYSSVSSMGANNEKERRVSSTKKKREKKKSTTDFHAGQKRWQIPAMLMITLSPALRPPKTDGSCAWKERMHGELHGPCHGSGSLEVALRGFFVLFSSNLTIVWPR